MKYYPLLRSHSAIETVILANGEYPSHPLPVGLLQQASFVVCCDGAADDYICRGNTPSLIIGDGDSISPENRERFKEILITSADQETNDQTKAVAYCLQQQRNYLLILGATGKREDHTLGNISLLMDYMHLGADVQMATDYGVFTPVQGDACFECVPGEQISLINFGATGIKGEGLVYPLSDFSNWWQGTLNQTTGDSFTIQAKGEYLIFRTY